MDNNNVRAEGTIGSAGIDLEKVGRFTTTGVSPEEVQEIQQKIVDMIKNTTGTFSVEKGLITGTAQNLEFKAEDITQGIKYPIVIIMNGVGGIGKDTFVNASNTSMSAYKMSSIDTVKRAADVLINANAGADEYEAVCASKHREEKTDSYRTFLNAIKTAWVEFCDGPVVELEHMISDVVSVQINGGECYDVIYIDIREIDEIDKLKKRVMERLGLPCLTVLIKGWINPNNFSNSGDANVYNYDYDLVINNMYGNVEIYKLQAKIFGTLITAANAMFGISVSSEGYITAVAPDSERYIEEGVALSGPIIGTINAQTIDDAALL